jgi:hypothetical protein
MTATKKPIPTFVYVLLLAVVAGAAATAIIFQINQPLVADEPQFVDVAHSLATTALPMGYSGSDWNPVLSHPLLYHSLVAVPVGLAGKAPWAGRLIGVLAFFGTGVLLWFTTKAATGERWGPFVAVLLYGLHPLALQSSLLVEIDTAVLPLAALVTIWFLVRRDFDLSSYGWVGLGLLFGVSLMAKLTTPPLLLAALFVYYLVRRQFGRAGRVVPAAALGVAVFALYYVPYCLIKGLPIAEPFVHSFGRAAAPTAAFGATVLKRAVKLVLWLGVPFLLAYIMTAFRRVRRLPAEAHPAIPYAGLAAAAIFVFYLLIGGDGYGFVKYHAPMVSLVALVLGAVFGPALAKESWRTVLFLGALALAYNVLVLRDPLYWPYIAREATDVLLARPEEVRKALVLTAAFVLVPVIAFLVMTRRGGRTMAFVILAATAGPALNVWHVLADYEHRYNYGERGLAEAAASLEAVPAGKAVVVPVDVAFAEHYAHEHTAVEEVLTGPEALRVSLMDEATGAVVLRDSYYLHAPYRAALEDEAVATILAAAYDMDRYGSFVVAFRKEEPTSEE